MKASRRNLSPAIRMEALVHYGHRCLYCGATPKESRLEVDHVIPVARGGTNDIGNLVVACRECNIGKGKRMLLDVTSADAGAYVAAVKPTEAPTATDGVPEAAWKASRQCENLVAAWLSQFSRWWPDIDILPQCIEVESAGESFSFLPTFVCRGRQGCDIGPEVRVLVVDWARVGRVALETQMQIRNAVISGYEVPTMVIMGPPSLFFGVLIKNRHKGTPEGWIVNHFLQPMDAWENSDWYPDEDMTFQDLRGPVHERLLVERWWDFANERFVGAFSSCDTLEVCDGV